MGKRGTKRIGKTRKALFAFSDFFYPVVSSFFPKQVYRYAFFGGMNVVLDNILFIFFFYVVLTPYEQNGIIDLGFFSIKRHVMALFLSAPIVVMVGFLSMRYIVFDRSRKEKMFFQFVKYVASSISGLLLNYVFIRIFVELANFSADISKITTSIIVVMYSYFFQTKITFRKKAI